MRRVAFILVVPFLLAGCAVPPALTLASLAADGVSYVATGKSTTDHAISAIAQEDCALVRAVKEEAICVPKGTAVAAFAGIDQEVVPVQRRVRWEAVYPKLGSHRAGGD
ncbi:MAG: hypothetical protein OEO83_09120 [Alphaproteobacteria bacterium]|nr:hypothetical protein [Alphaproteobacteria bacterium]